LQFSREAGIWGQWPGLQFGREAGGSSSSEAEEERKRWY